MNKYFYILPCIMFLGCFLLMYQHSEKKEKQQLKKVVIITQKNSKSC